MYAAKFTVFYVIAALAALVSASPIPVTEPGALALPVANVDVVAREPLPLAEAVVEREPTPEDEDVEARICRYGCL